MYNVGELTDVKKQDGDQQHGDQQHGDGCGCFVDVCCLGDGSTNQMSCYSQVSSACS